jgi:hypothetical protein
MDATTIRADSGGSCAIASVPTEIIGGRRPRGDRVHSPARAMATMIVRVRCETVCIYHVGVSSSDVNAGRPDSV